MKTKTESRLEDAQLSQLVQRIGSLSHTARAQNRDHGYASRLPEEVGFQLTNRCNLSCTHCFQWNETGFHHDFSEAQKSADLDVELFERVLEETREVRSSLFLWGGEPLIYGEWERLAAALRRDPRWTVLCTNGVGIQKKLDSILPISSHLTALISLDGFEEENDRLRGRNTFRHVLGNVELLLDLKRKGEYRGEVSVSAVLSGDLVGRLYEFVELFDDLGINTLYLVYPWYIPSATATRMDEYFAQHFDWLTARRRPEPAAARRKSWHSYTYHLDPERLDALREALVRIGERTWKIRVRFRPELDLDEVDGFARGSEAPGEGRTRCLSIATRMNVMPDGGVTTCKLFPEFVIGNLNGRSVAEVWHSAAARRARQTLARGLTPICSKCVQLYLHGV